MAGSFQHAVTKKGKLRSNRRFVQMVENLGDAYETVEEMFGMIQWLARRGPGDPKALIEEARVHYRDGIAASVRKPTDVELVSTDNGFTMTEEEQLAYRQSLDPRLIEDWEEYIGDSLESAGMVDEFHEAWHAAKRRFEKIGEQHG